MGRELSEGVVASSEPIGTIKEFASNKKIIGDYIKSGELIDNTSQLADGLGYAKVSSTKGIFNTMTNGTRPAVNSIESINGIFYMVSIISANDILVWYSQDSVSWDYYRTTLSKSLSSTTATKLVTANNRLFVCGSCGLLEVKSNGKVVELISGLITDIDWDGTQYIIANATATIKMTTDFITFTNSTALNSTQIASACKFISSTGRYIALCSNSSLQYTTSLSGAWVNGSAADNDVATNYILKKGDTLIALCNANKTFKYTTDGVTFSNSVSTATSTSIGFDGTRWFYTLGSYTVYYLTSLSGTHVSAKAIDTYSDSHHVAYNGSVYLQSGYTFGYANGAIRTVLDDTTQVKQFSPIYVTPSDINHCGNHIKVSNISTSTYYASTVYSVTSELVFTMVPTSSALGYIMQPNMTFAGTDNYRNYMILIDYPTNKAYMFNTSVSGVAELSIVNGVIQTPSTFPALTINTSNAVVTDPMYVEDENDVYYRNNAATYGLYSIKRGLITTLSSSPSASFSVSDNGSVVLTYNDTGNATFILDGNKKAGVAISSIIKLFNKSGTSVAVASAAWIDLVRVNGVFYTSNNGSTLYAGTSLLNMVEIGTTFGGLRGTTSDKFVVSNNSIGSLSGMMVASVDGVTKGTLISKKIPLTASGNIVTQNTSGITWTDTNKSLIPYVYPSSLGKQVYVKFQ